MKRIIFLIQISVLILQTLIYFSSESKTPDFFIINFSATTVLISFILSWAFRNKTFLNGYGFSIIVFFIIMNWIISFQAPLEIVYGNSDLLEPGLNLIYDSNILNKLVAFSSLMLNLFLIGVTISYSKGVSKKNNYIKNYYKIPTNPLLIIIFLLFFVFLIFVKEFVILGHGNVKLNPISETSIGFIIKLSAIYLAIKLFNNQDKKLSLNEYTYKLNYFYILFLFLALFLFFIAHNRVYPIMIFTPLIFSFFLYSYKKVKISTVFFIFIILSIFATLFKIYGFLDFYKSGLNINEEYNISKFLFPFTAELAGSIYSSTILYSIWENNDFSLNGASYFIGLLRVFPGTMGLLKLNPLTYDSAIVATLISNVSYGVGTTAIGDLLVNFGKTLSLLFFLILGYFFGRSEMKVYIKNTSIYAYVTYLSITILLLFFPRSSMNDLISMLFFNLIFTKFYIIFFKEKVK